MSKTVTLAHGAGGKQTSELIHEVFEAHFSNPLFTPDDAAVIDMEAGKIAMSTDGFIVSPFEFPGGNVGKLSICGTVNDLSCMGAKPMYLTCAFVIEEGFPMDKLEEIAASMEKTADEAGVRIVAGDTKVAGRGQVDGVFITTTGIGRIRDHRLHGQLVKTQLGHVFDVLGEVGIAVGVGAAHVIFGAVRGRRLRAAGGRSLVPAGSCTGAAARRHQPLKLWHDQIVASLIIDGPAEPVVDFLSSVQTQDHVVHFPVGEFDDLIV